MDVARIVARVIVMVGVGLEFWMMSVSFHIRLFQSLW